MNAQVKLRTLLMLGVVIGATAASSLGCMGDAVNEIQGKVLTLPEGNSHNSRIEKLPLQPLEEFPTVSGAQPVVDADVSTTWYLNLIGRETRKSYTRQPIKTDAKGYFKTDNSYSGSIMLWLRKFRIDITAEGYEPVSTVLPMGSGSYKLLVMLKPTETQDAEDSRP